MTDTTADLLRQAGEVLYGPRWQSDLARDLDVAIRTVQRWAAESVEMPSTVWPEIRALLKARGSALAAVRRRIPR